MCPYLHCTRGAPCKLLVISLGLFQLFPNSISAKCGFGGCSNGAAEQEGLLTAVAALTAFAVRRRKQGSALIAQLASFHAANPDLSTSRGIALGVLVSGMGWCAIMSLII